MPGATERNTRRVLRRRTRRSSRRSFCPAGCLLLVHSFPRCGRQIRGVPHRDGNRTPKIRMSAKPPIFRHFDFCRPFWPICIPPKNVLSLYYKIGTSREECPFIFAYIDFQPLTFQNASTWATEYRGISSLGCGLVFKVPRYLVTKVLVVLQKWCTGPLQAADPVKLS